MLFDRTSIDKLFGDSISMTLIPFSRLHEVSEFKQEGHEALNLSLELTG